MISSKQIQNAYIQLYKVLREYIWPSKVVSEIADLEVSIYKSFPDLDEIRNNYNKLKVSCFRYIDEDEDLEIEFEDFREVLDSSDTLYAKLNTRLEGAE